MKPDIRFDECNECEYRDYDTLACRCSLLGLAFNRLAKSVPVFGKEVEDLHCGWFMRKED